MLHLPFRRARWIAGALALAVPAALAVTGLPADAAVVAVGPAEADLRAALATANANGEADELVLTPDAVYDLTCAAGGQLLHDEAQGLTISGNGATIRQTCDGERVLEHDSPALLVIEDVTLTGGSSSGDGGAILTQGTVVVAGSSLVDNSNGVIDAEAGDVTLVGTTVAGNHHEDGTLVSAGDGALTVVNSTVTGNSTNNSVLFGEDGVTLAYATITGNDAPEHVRSSFLGQDSMPGLDAFASVITATDTGGPACDLPDDAPVTSFGYNHVADTSCRLDAATDEQDAGDPSLGPLASNGGPTATMLPAAGSPLLDVIPADDCMLGPAAAIGSDQRGVARPQGAGCDIGAVEVEVELPEPAPEPEPSAQPAAPSALPVTAAPRFTG